MKRKLGVAGQLARQGDWRAMAQKARRSLAPVVAPFSQIHTLTRDALRYHYWQRRPRRSRLPLHPAALARQKSSASHGRIKNVIWIVLDALRQDIFDEYVRRGGFANLISGGLYFPRAFAQGSWTYPSLFSFLTACYPFNCGVSRLLAEDGKLLSVCADFDETRPTLFSLLRQRGYQVASILDGWGFTVRSTAGQQHREDQYFEDNWGWSYGQGRRFLRLDEQREAMLSQIAQFRPGHPFFLFVRSLYTHSPYREIFTDGDYVTRLSRRGWRFALVEGFLRGLRRFETNCLQPVLMALARTKQLDNTLIVLCSDHGDMFWNLEADLRQQDPGEEAWRHELEPYQALVKVPLLIWGTERQGVYPGRFRLMDVVPTLLDELSVGYEREQFDGASVYADMPRPLYADSAGHGNGGVAFQADGPKLLMSARLGAVSYNIADEDYETLERRSAAAGLVGEVQAFVERAARDSGFVADRSDDALIRRLRALGYLE